MVVTILAGNPDSQVLFREAVRGRLLTEARWWAAARESLGSKYPPPRAARLAAELAAPPDTGGEASLEGGSSDGGGGGGATPRGDAAPQPLQQLRLLVTGAPSSALCLVPLSCRG